MLDALLVGLETVFSVPGVVALLVGVMVGIVVGALPGLGPSVGIALLIPFTYDLPASYSMVLLVAIYVAGEYGGSITAILLAAPGTAAATATVVDGYPLNRERGLPGLALGISLSASTVGGLLGTIALITLLHPLVAFALQFGPPAYFAVGLFALTSVASLSSGAMAKGLASGVLGLAIATVGIDPISGVPRFTFGRIELDEGVPLLAAIIGLFALSEVFNMAERGARAPKVQTDIKHVFLTLRQWGELIATMLRGSIIGVLLGILPGVGASIAGWLAYDTEKRLSRRPEEFGKGALAGVAAPEAANNASVGGALIPMLALGIPGSATTAVLIGALVLHGLQPGPQLLTEAPDVVYGLFVALGLGAAVMYLFGSLALPLWVRMLAAPNAVLATAVFGLGVIGAYSLRSLIFDVWLAVGFGILGWLFKKYRFPLAPMILGLVLFEMIEGHFRRSLLMSRGSYLIFLEEPLSLFFLILCGVALLWPLLQRHLARRRGGRTRPADSP